MSDYTQNMASSNAAYTKGMAGRKKVGNHIDFYRKNGVPRVRIVKDGPKKDEPKKEGPKKRNGGAYPQTYGYGFQKDMPQGVKQPAGAQEAAKRRTNTLDERRAKRIAHGEHKGKYLGPEAFKGDMKMLKTYRAGGSKGDPKEFAKDFKKKYGQETGWRGTHNQGQGAGEQWSRETPKAKGRTISSRTKNANEMEHLRRRSSS